MNFFRALLGSSLIFMGFICYINGLFPLDSFGFRINALPVLRFDALYASLLAIFQFHLQKCFFEKKTNLFITFLDNGPF